jgi:hypothetical protein
LLYSVVRVEHPTKTNCILPIIFGLIFFNISMSDLKWYHFFFIGDIEEKNIAILYDGLYKGYWLRLWVRIPLMARCTRYNIMWSSLSVVFSGYSVSPTNKTDCHYIAEILLKVALNTITLTLILLVIVFVFTFNISVMITRLIERSGQL